MSRRFVAANGRNDDDRDLSTISLCAIVIDGIHMGEHLIVVALEIYESGDKHVLGLHDGATENESVCPSLLADFGARGVRTDRMMLFVIDDSKALVSAGRKTFGKHAPFNDAKCTSVATSKIACLKR